MWANVTKRSHTVHKIFPIGNESNQIMLYGEVEYDLKDGSHSKKDWAARADLIQQTSAGVWQLKFYQVYLVYNLVQVQEQRQC